MEALHTTTLWTWWCLENVARNCEKQKLPKKIDTSKTPRQLHTAVPEHGAQPASAKWFPVGFHRKGRGLSRRHLSPASCQVFVLLWSWCCMPLLGGCHHAQEAKAKAKAKASRGCGCYGFTKRAVFENICKTVFVFFPKLVGSGLWKLNMWKIAIIFNYSFCFVCLNSLNLSSPSMHPPLHRASGTSVSLDLRK